MQVRLDARIEQDKKPGHEGDGVGASTIALLALKL